MYGGEWFLIEEFSYSVLLNKCLEKQAEQENNVAEEEEAMAEEHNEEMAQEEQDNDVPEEEAVAEEQNEEMAQEEQEQTAQEEEEVEVINYLRLKTGFLNLIYPLGYLTCNMIYLLYYRRSRSRSSVLRMEETMLVATQHLWWDVVPRQVHRFAKLILCR